MTFLRKAHVKLRTKIFLGLSLCLSVVIVTVVITQISGLHVPGSSTIDVVWEVYWQYVEAMVAIIIVCLSAFRSFFIQHNTRNQSPPKRSWYAGVKASLTNKSSDKEAWELSHIPGATLTGIRTYIGGTGRENVHGTDNIQNQDEDLLPLHDPADGQKIRVQHNISTHWEPVTLSALPDRCI